MNHRLPLEEQLREVHNITSGNFSRVFDASAMATEIGIAALAKVSADKDEIKYFATTNDWYIAFIGRSCCAYAHKTVHRTPIVPQEGIKIYQADLGGIGQGGEEREINKKVAAYIPLLEKYLSTGALKPMEYEQVGDIGVEEILKGLVAFNTKKGSAKKMVVRLSAH